MKASILSAIFFYLSAVDAESRRLCCCIDVDETCLQAPNEEIVKASGRKFISNLPSHNWYAANDGLVSDDEAAGLCGAKGFASTCFTPSTDIVVKRSQNVNQNGEVVVLEVDLNIVGRDVVRRKSNGTKHHGAGWYKKNNATSTGSIGRPTSTAVPVEVADFAKRDFVRRKSNKTKHHGAGWYKKNNATSTRWLGIPTSTASPTGFVGFVKREVSQRKKNRTKHHGAGWYKKNNSTAPHFWKNSTSTKPHGGPTSTATPTEVSDLMERDILERKTKNGRKHHGAGWYKKNNSTTNSTNTKPHSKPTTTAAPMRISDLTKRHIPFERKTNDTTTKPHHGRAKSLPSGKPKTTFHRVTKSAHYYGNSTAATASWTSATASASATPSKGSVVYCNPFWKAHGCVDLPDPSVKPVVCGQYWKARGCVDSTVSTDV